MSRTPIRGFILHPTYRLEAGRPVVYLFGRLEDGRSFLVRDRRLVPYFFLRAQDAEAARAHGAARQSPIPFTSLRGEPLVRLEVDAPEQLPAVRDALAHAGLPVFEADVRFAMRYLIDHGIKGAVEIEAGPSDGDTRAAPTAPRGYAVDALFDDPTVRPSDFHPEISLLRVLSIDLETDPRGERIDSAALVGPGVEEVLLALPEDAVRSGLGSRAAPCRVVPCADEKGLLKALFARMREIDFDVLTGWNVIDFDLEVLLARSRALGVPFEVGRGPGAARVIRERAFWGRSRADITGRVVLDGIDLMRSSFMKLDDYRLDTVARVVLGQGKVDLGGPHEGMTGRQRAQAIERTFRSDLPLFIEYNLADARLVLQILDKAKLIELAVKRSLLTGMPLDRVGASIASFDFLYLRELRRRGRIAPSVGAGMDPAGTEAHRAAGDPEEGVVGGAVLEPVPGLYDHVLAFDFKSLYPSLIRTFNIDPLGHVPDPAPGELADLIRAPNGALFRREPGILPEILERLFPQRDEAKKRGDSIGAHALKILMNSFYGVLATPACRFYSLPVANAITRFGQWVLHWTRDRVEALGHRVLYGDTDSLFVASSSTGPGAEDEAHRLGESLRDRINIELRDEIWKSFRVESRLELEFETLFLKFFLPSMRHGTGGARKRYAGLVRQDGRDGGARVVFVGMEVVRRDWTELSKIYQRGLFERLFGGAGQDEVLSYTRDFVRDLKDGRHDAHLIYRKALRKGLDQYTATTPPHVKAARQVEGKVEGLVEYVMTASGPQPRGAVASPIDHAHYVEKQLRPIAEQVFPYLGLSFDAALGEATQLRLF